MGSTKDEEAGPSSGDALATETSTTTVVEREVRAPRRYKVLLHNDNYTTMEFVVMVLRHVFHLGEAEATAIMLQVHSQGVGTAGVFSREEAEARVDKVARMARAQEHPLRCSMEPA